jgi:hypothetical protein
MTSRIALGWILGAAGVLAAAAGCGRQAVVAPAAADLALERPLDAPEGQPKEDAPGGEFAFPGDAGGALLAKLLPPSDKAGGPGERARQPVPRPASRAFEATARPLPSFRAAAVVPPLPAKVKGVALLPRLVSEETLEAPRERLALPAEIVLPAMERVRVPSPDANEPVSLPILARPVTDRVSLEDPTADASTAAALAATLPRRIIPAPFLRLSLPEPFEYRRPLTLAIPAESTEPLTSTPQTPKP